MRKLTFEINNFNLKLNSLSFSKYLCFMLMFFLSACDTPWNSPYPKQLTKGKVLYSTFSSKPKHLDPARSFEISEARIINQIYEPVLQYDYLKRPYQLVPLTATHFPEVRYYNKDNLEIAAENIKDFSYAAYIIQIKPDIKFAEHPAFANYKQLKNQQTVFDFKKTATRELVADDYIYQIKRLASPEVQSPIYSLMADKIIGMRDLRKQLTKEFKKIKASENQENNFLDLRKFNLKGVEKLDKYTYKISIKQHYPQFKFWLATTFFAPMPVEADKFYHLAGMKNRNISIDWYPVGTGAYKISFYNPVQRIILSKNKNYRKSYYPTINQDNHKYAKLKKHSNKRIPFLDSIVLSLEKESIPTWNKFLQGYYDTSGISTDSFSQAIQTTPTGEFDLTEQMQEKRVRLKSSVSPSIFYWGFNMLDKKVGGYTEKNKKLRQAIGIALNVEEFISIFLNGRGIPAQSPIPPSVFGYQQAENGYNPKIYNWQNNKLTRNSLETAKHLMAEAGYPDGIDQATGKPLVIHYDAVLTAGPDEAARFDWLRKQLQKLGIVLDIRATQYGRFQEKILNGDFEMFMWGWIADYPDPENFLFLLYGPNSKVKYHGENAANYKNKNFDKLYEIMRSLPDGENRQQLINSMLDIIRDDSPWIFAYHPKSYQLMHDWVEPFAINQMAHNTMKYLDINPKLREKQQDKWNAPVLWPLYVIIILLLISIIPAIYIYHKMEHKKG